MEYATYLTADVKRKAQDLGIDKKDSSKLYRTAKELNNFFRDFELGLEQNEIDTKECEDYEEYEC